MRKLVWVTLGFAAACAVGAYLAGGFWLLLAGLFLLPAGLVPLFLLRGHDGKVRAVGYLCVGFALGALWFWGYDTLALPEERAMDGLRMETTVTVTDYPTDKGGYTTAEGELQTAAGKVKVFLYLEDNLALAPGDGINADFLFRSAAPGGSRESAYRQADGIFLVAYAQNQIAITPAQSRSARYIPCYIRHWLLETMDTVFPGGTAGFAKALLLGDTGGLSYKTDTALKLSGIRHVAAVSGLHVSILMSLIYMGIGRRRKLTALVGIAVLFAFAAVAGFSPSVVRACMMQGLMLLGLFFDQEYDPPTSLAAAVFFMLAVNPYAVTSVSLQLSAASVAGILLLSGKIQSWIVSRPVFKDIEGKSKKGRLLYWFSGSVSVSLGAMLFTTPVSALHFDMVSLVGIVTNLLTLWLVTYIFIGIMIVCVVAAFWTLGAQILAWVVSLGIYLVLGAATLLSKIPMSAVYTCSPYIVFWLVFCYGLLAVFLLSKRKRPQMLGCCVVTSLCLCLCLSWGEPMLDNCRVTMLDVGQGQCILLQSRGRNFLVDCGGDSDTGAADTAAVQLASQGIFHLDGLIVTHFDADHVGGVAHLLSRVSAKTVYVPSNAQTGYWKGVFHPANVEKVEQPIALEWGGTVLSLLPSKAGKTDNDSGLAILFQTEKCDILITGDKSADAERLLLRDADLPDVDILVVGHHGGADAACQELLDAVKPETALISVGNNSHGHPSQQTLYRLKRFGCRIHRTDKDGTIILKR